MTIKQKFSSIDQSKLTADQKSFLDKIKNVTKNFTDAEMNKKVEAPLDNFIAKAKDKMPEAIKSAPVKRTAKAKTSQTRKPKRTAMSLAKEIRKEGESWKDAQVRARKMMKEDSQSLSKTVESELDKLSKLVKSEKTRSKLVGISGTDIKRDAVRKAKPRGARKVTHSGETSNQYGTFSNKLGRKYYESRDRHSDRLAPNYPKNAPLLESGAYLTDGTFGNFQNQVLAEGGDIDAFTLRMVKSNGMQPAEMLKEDANVKYNRGGSVTNERRYVNKGEDYEVRYSRPILRRKGYEGKRDFELGGVMATDLAGHTGGGDSGLNAGMPLDGFSNTGYTGLVGETGAMSSGEMFMNGGGVEEWKKGVTIKIDTRQEAEKNKKLLKEYWGKSGRNFEVEKRGNGYVITYEFYLSDKMELGGGLPSGVSQSYMITESLGNPAQHFAKGGGIPNNYEGKTNEQIWNLWSEEQKTHFLYDHLMYGNPKVLDENGGIRRLIKLKFKELPLIVQMELNFHRKEGQYAKGGGVKIINGKEYAYGRNWTNDHRHINQDEEHEVTYNRKGKFLGIFNDGGAVTNERKHVNHDEDYEVRYSKPRPHKKGYKGARKFMAGGMNDESPRIYVADLEAYNNGRLVGEWLDLADYNDADELMDAIQDVLKKSGGEEYAIHDVEYVPRSLYSEYMSRNDFEALYEVMETAKRFDLPLEVVQEIVSQYGEGGVDEFNGKYDNAEDFAQQLVDDIGIESFNSYEYYMYVTNTDRRLIAQEQADFYVDNIRNEDGGNRLIEEAGMDVDEYEEADSEMQEEMLDKAREIVYDDYYNTWYEGLDDPKNFLVDEQGIYDTESFANLSFVNVDYEKLGRDLEQDYTFIEHDGELYVFNIR